MTSSVNCLSCSAIVIGFICEHCGRMAAHANNAVEEARALEEFHHLLHKLAPDVQSRNTGEMDAPLTPDEADREVEEADKREQKVIHLLRTGFIPDHKEVLIDAGVYCIPYLESNSDLEDAARSRLESITTKLKLIQQQDAQTKLAIEEFQTKIKEHKTHRSREDVFYGGFCLLIFVLIVAGIIWLFSSC